MSGWNQSCIGADKPSRTCDLEKINHRVSLSPAARLLRVYTLPPVRTTNRAAHLRKPDESDYIFKKNIVRITLASDPRLQLPRTRRCPRGVRLRNYHPDGVVTSATLGGRGLCTSLLIYGPLGGKRGKVNFHESPKGGRRRRGGLEFLLLPPTILT